MDSYKWAPSSLSGIRAMEGSAIVVELKMAKAWRCRSGEEGAVNWNTEKNYEIYPLKKFEGSNLLVLLTRH